MKRKKKQFPKSKILILCCIILIPVIAGIFAIFKHHFELNNSSIGGVYSHKDNSLVTYNTNDVNKINELEHNRQSLNLSDEEVKNALTEKPNPLAKTEDFIITYNQTTDIFQAEITTISINNAKEEVVEWFNNQGMSTEALCELPLSFTLEASIANSLKGLDIIFDPLYEGC